jgi:citrate lyase alpha subunit
MAKSNKKRLTAIKATSLANLQGTFASIIGLGVAILASLETTINVADSTDSVLRGLVFGLAAGVVSIIVVPLIYFAIGWVVGLVQGWVYNVILGAAGGLVVDLEDE